MTSRPPALLSVVAAAITPFLVLAIGNAQVVPNLSQLTATVVDQTGAALADSEVVFSHDSKPIVCHTGPDGSVTVHLLSGTYAITAKQVGFLKTEIVDLRLPASPAELKIVLKVDPNFCKNGGCTCSGPTCADALRLPSTTSSASCPEAIPESKHVPLDQPRAQKHRSWQCVYLWNCSTR